MSLSHIFQAKQFLKRDYDSFWNLTILGLEDEEECDTVKNEILTNYKLVNHILNCSICIEQGLINCNELEKLKGVYDKIPFQENQKND